MRRKEVYSSANHHEKMGDSCRKAHLNISVQAGIFIRKERESRTVKSGSAGSVLAGPDIDP